MAFVLSQSANLPALAMLPGASMAATTPSSNVDFAQSLLKDVGVTGYSSSITPYQPSWGGSISALAFGGMALAGFFAGRRGLSKYFQKGLATATDKAVTVADNAANKFQLFRNIDNPLLTMAFLSQQPALKGVLGWFGVASVLGFIGGNVLQGMQETWIRAEETAIRMRAMEGMVAPYQQSIRDRNRFLTALKAQTTHTLRSWLAQAGIKDSLLTSSLGVGTNANGAFAAVPPQRAAQLQQNYLMEPRHRVPLSNNQASTPLFSSEAQHTSAAQPNTALTPLSARQWWPWFSGAVGGAVGMVAAGIHTTLGNFRQLVGRTVSQTAEREMITGLFVKNTEALAVLARQLEAPGLLLAYGLAVGLITAGQKFVEGVREIAVTEENTHTELAYQRYRWQDLGSRLMAVAETEWVASQLAQFGPQLTRNTRPSMAQQQDLIQQAQTIVQGIGFNSTPPHYNTPLELNITEARS